MAIYEVLESLTSGDRSYAPGDPIEIDDDDAAKSLIELGAIAPLDDKKDPEIEIESSAEDDFADLEEGEATE